jgi:hypothetical protein
MKLLEKQTYCNYSFPASRVEECVDFTVAELIRSTTGGTRKRGGKASGGDGKAGKI